MTAETEIRTLADLRIATAHLPADYIVRGYEGEGGAWVIVEPDPAGTKFATAAVHLHTE
jgi:hypothetical protein